MRETICRIIGILLCFAIVMAFTFGLSVALVAIGAWAFGFAFSVRYGVALWAALCVMYALILPRFPKR